MPNRFDPLPPEAHKLFREVFSHILNYYNQAENGFISTDTAVNAIAEIVNHYYRELNDATGDRYAIPLFKL